VGDNPRILTEWLSTNPQMNEDVKKTIVKQTTVIARPIMSSNIFDLSTVPDNIMFWLVLLQLGKRNPASVERLLKTLFQACGDALEAYCRAGAGNRITAWGSGVLTSIFMERFGLLTHAQTTGFHLGLNIIAGAEITEEIAAEIMSIFPWNFANKDLDFPTTLVLGDKSRTFKVTRGVK